MRASQHATPRRPPPSPAASYIASTSPIAYDVPWYEVKVGVWTIESDECGVWCEMRTPTHQAGVARSADSAHQPGSRVLHMLHETGIPANNAVLLFISDFSWY